MISRFLVALCSVLMIGNFAFGQESVVMRIDNEPVTISEFTKIFKKNNKDTVITKNDLDEYVELFVDFKLKVKEARSLGMDTLRKFINELSGYRRQLAKPYLTDSELKETLVREAYDRMNEEVRASHILLKVAENASPADTLKAYKKIIEYRRRVQAGELFSRIAKGSSDDPSAGKNGGDLGYFSAFMMVYPFESAAFNTKVGEISEPVRTRFGYHILEVKDRRPARGEITVAHIMVASTDKDDDQKKKNAEIKAKEIFDKAIAGEDFGDLARNHSDDKTSGRKGGELPAFGTGKMVAEFEEAAFSIDKDGGIVGPIKSPYGWHIIKRLSHDALPSYDEMLVELRTKVARDSRSQLTAESFINRLKKEYNFKEKNRKSRFEAAVDSTIFFGEWDPRKGAKLKKKLFTLNGEVYRESDFVQYLNAFQRNETRNMRKGVPFYLEGRYKRFVETKILAYEDTQLERKYPDFKALMQEYNDGILLFELMDKKVWSKAVQDSAGLFDFYEANKTQFMWPTRYDVSIFSAANRGIANEAVKMVSEGQSDSLILATINKNSQLNLAIKSGVFAEEDKEELGLFVLEKGTTIVKGLNDRYLFLNIREIVPPSPRTMEDAKGLITAAYQNHLEKGWIQELRNKYTVEVNKDVLYTVK